jgi:hypothetical protein
LPPEKKKKVDEIIFGKGPHIKKKPAKWRLLYLSDSGLYALRQNR